MKTQSLRDLLNGNSSDGAHPQGAQTRYALAYLRVSTEEQNEEAQRADIERYAAREGITVLEWFRDHALSASSDHEKREGFWRMIEIAKSDRRVSLILVWDESRFFRDQLQAAVVELDLLRHGVNVIPVKHPYNPNTVDGVILKGVHRSLAQAEAIKIAERTIAGMMHNCTQRDPQTGWAFHNGGRPKWGYRAEQVRHGTDKHGKPDYKEIWLLDETTEVDRPRWQWVRVVLLDWMVNERASDKEIIRRLNRLGVQTYEKAHGVMTTRKCKGKWSASTLNDLRRPESLLTYAGWYFWNKCKRRNEAGDRKGRRRKPPSEWQRVENAHPAILTMEEAERVMEEAERRNNPRQRIVNWRTEGSPYLLTGGVLTCAACGSNLNGRAKYGLNYHDSKGEDVPHYYICPECRPLYYLRCADVDDPIWQVIGDSLTLNDQQMERIAQRVNRRRSPNDAARDAERKALQRRLKEIDRDKERLREAFRAGADVQFVADESRRLKSEEEDARRQLTDLQAKADDAPKRTVTVNDVRRLVNTFTRLKEHGTNEERRQVVRAFVKRGQLHADAQRVDVEFFQPEDASIQGVVPGAGLEPARTLRLGGF